MTSAASDESLVSTESSKRKLAEGEKANQQPSPQVLDEAAVRADRKRRRCVKAANSVTCLAQGVQQLLSAPALIPNTELTLQAAGDLPRLLKQNIFEVLRLNMRDMYENAQGWGWDGEGKWEELFAPEARYLICQQTEEPHAVLGFSHFRFTIDDDGEPAEAVLYVYELQLAEGARRKGLGLRMMQILEALAAKHCMAKTMLTVFNENAAAMSFYRSKAGYEIDASSPSCWDREEDFEILSKPVPSAVTATSISAVS
jgi:ribosomal protein S18 acetylase RimI-like enzyme